ncbi:hypothetical protein CBR_g31861 [Chara braunii]|uniref:RING-type domain-containing protein n=1 Tax=Chara braunii TaxID=69332 RepID=A0A388LFV5_CHABU|nr:hypothetical protein CBR_g31861 [Chara braunii]|eukprot:GBG81188.1 hypothetical protein CBR_g31861 [Chara braunii]
MIMAEERNASISDGRKKRGGGGAEAPAVVAPSDEEEDEEGAGRRHKRLRLSVRRRDRDRHRGRDRGGKRAIGWEQHGRHGDDVGEIDSNGGGLHVSSLGDHARGGGSDSSLDAAASAAAEAECPPADCHSDLSSRPLEGRRLGLDGALAGWCSATGGPAGGGGGGGGGEGGKVQRAVGVGGRGGCTGGGAREGMQVGGARERMEAKGSRGAERGSGTAIGAGGGGDAVFSPQKVGRRRAIGLNALGIVNEGATPSTCPVLSPDAGYYETRSREIEDEERELVKILNCHRQDGDGGVGGVEQQGPLPPWLRPAVGTFAEIFVPTTRGLNACQLLSGVEVGSDSGKGHVQQHQRSRLTIAGSPESGSVSVGAQCCGLKTAGGEIGKMMMSQGTQRKGDEGRRGGGGRLGNRIVEGKREGEVGGEVNGRGGEEREGTRSSTGKVALQLVKRGGGEEGDGVVASPYGSPEGEREKGPAEAEGEEGREREREGRQAVMGREGRIEEKEGREGGREEREGREGEREGRECGRYWRGGGREGIEGGREVIEGGREGKEGRREGIEGGREGKEGGREGRERGEGGREERKGREGGREVKEWGRDWREGGREGIVGGSEGREWGKEGKDRGREGSQRGSEEIGNSIKACDAVQKLTLSTRSDEKTAVVSCSDTVGQICMEFSSRSTGSRETSSVKVYRRRERREEGRDALRSQTLPQRGSFSPSPSSSVPASAQPTGSTEGDDMNASPSSSVPPSARARTGGEDMNAARIKDKRSSEGGDRAMCSECINHHPSADPRVQETADDSRYEDAECGGRKRQRLTSEKENLTMHLKEDDQVEDKSGERGLVGLIFMPARPRRGLEELQTANEDALGLSSGHVEGLASGAERDLLERAKQGERRGEPSLKQECKEELTEEMHGAQEEEEEEEEEEDIVQFCSQIPVCEDLGSNDAVRLQRGWMGGGEGSEVTTWRGSCHGDENKNGDIDGNRDASEELVRIKHGKRPFVACAPVTLAMHSADVNCGLGGRGAGGEGRGGGGGGGGGGERGGERSSKAVGRMHCGRGEAGESRKREGGREGERGGRGGEGERGGRDGWRGGAEGWMDGRGGGERGREGGTGGQEGEGGAREEAGREEIPIAVQASAGGQMGSRGAEVWIDGRAGGERRREGGTGGQEGERGGGEGGARKEAGRERIPIAVQTNAGGQTGSLDGRDVGDGQAAMAVGPMDDEVRSGNVSTGRAGVSLCPVAWTDEIGPLNEDPDNVTPQKAGGEASTDVAQSAHRSVVVGLDAGWRETEREARDKDTSDGMLRSAAGGDSCGSVEDALVETDGADVRSREVEKPSRSGFGGRSAADLQKEDVLGVGERRRVHAAPEGLRGVEGSPPTTAEMQRVVDPSDQAGAHEAEPQISMGRREDSGRDKGREERLRALGSSSPTAARIREGEMGIGMERRDDSGRDDAGEENRGGAGRNPSITAITDGGVSELRGDPAAAAREGEGGMGEGRTEEGGERRGGGSGSNATERGDGGFREGEPSLAMAAGGAGMEWLTVAIGGPAVGTSEPLLAMTAAGAEAEQSTVAVGGAAVGGSAVRGGDLQGVRRERSVSVGPPVIVIDDEEEDEFQTENFEGREPSHVREVGDNANKAGGGGSSCCQHAVHNGEVGGTQRTRGSLDADGATCMICMEPWTGTGSHRICSLGCGHLFGRSCIKRWLKQGGRRNGKCPQCLRKARVEDLRNLYVPRIAVVDATQQGQAAEELKALQLENQQLKRQNAQLLEEAKRMESLLEFLHPEQLAAFRGLQQSGSDDRSGHSVGGLVGSSSHHWESLSRFRRERDQGPRISSRPSGDCHHHHRRSPLELSSPATGNNSRKANNPTVQNPSQRPWSSNPSDHCVSAAQRSETSSLALGQNERLAEPGRGSGAALVESLQRQDRVPTPIQNRSGGKSGVGSSGMAAGTVMQRETSWPRGTREGGAQPVSSVTTGRSGKEQFPAADARRGEVSGSARLPRQRPWYAQHGTGFEAAQRWERPSLQSLRSSSSLASIGSRGLEGTFSLQDALPVSGARVFDMDAGSQLLLVSSRRTTEGSSGFFGLTKVSLLSIGCTDKILLPSEVGAIRDIRFAPPLPGRPPAKLALVASLGKRLTLVNTESNSVVLSYSLPAATWSCAWDLNNPYQMYSGMQNGSLMIFDLRQTTGPLATLKGSTQQPVHTLQYVGQPHEHRHSARQTLDVLWSTLPQQSGNDNHQCQQQQQQQGQCEMTGVLAASFSEVSFWDVSAALSRGGGDIYRPYVLPSIQPRGVCTSLAFHQGSWLTVASFRPTPQKGTLTSSVVSCTPSSCSSLFSGTRILPADGIATPSSSSAPAVEVVSGTPHIPPPSLSEALLKSTPDVNHVNESATGGHLGEATDRRGACSSPSSDSSFLEHGVHHVYRRRLPTSLPFESSRLGSTEGRVEVSACQDEGLRPNGKSFVTSVSGSDGNASVAESKYDRVEWVWEQDCAMLGHRNHTVMTRSALFSSSLPIDRSLSNGNSRGICVRTPEDGQQQNLLFAYGDEASNALWLWDMATGQVIHRLVPHESPVLDAKHMHVWGTDREILGSLSEKTLQLYIRVGGESHNNVRYHHCEKGIGSRSSVKRY